MVDSNPTLTSSNLQEFVNDNNNSYRSIVMDATKMNQNDSGEGSCNIPLD
jgi:hypothetical protein